MFDELPNGVVLYMNNPNNTQGNAGAAGNSAAPGPNAGAAGNNAASGPNWGKPNQPKAGKVYGSMLINDTSNTNYTYNVGGNNQPLLGNIGLALDHQRSLGNTTLSRYMFSPSLERFMLEHLLHTNRPMYDKLMHDVTHGDGYKYMPKWWNQSNSREFRDLFR